MKFVGLPKELGIKGRTFVTAGTLTTIDTSSTNYYDDSSLRLTTGAGVLWQSPFGPIRLTTVMQFWRKVMIKQTFSFNVGVL